MPSNKFRGHYIKLIYRGWIMLRYLETHITDHCNLKCASCLHFSCLVDKPYFKDLQSFELEAKRISEICGKDGYELFV